MADFRIAKTPKSDDEPKPFKIRSSKQASSRPRLQPEEITPEESASLLSKAGGAAMSGLHTLGSVLSLPSRLIHGTINAATGGEGGFGNLNPIDDTGGIQGSRHLVRMGILPENDPNKWELHDFTRGLADLALDPTTYLAVGALTKAGTGAAKLGKLAPGVLNQISQGERALVGLRAPFAREAAATLGTGQKVAGALESAGRYTGASRAAKAISESAPARAWNAMMRHPFMGKLEPAIQKGAIGRDEAYRAAVRRAEEDVSALALRADRMGLNTPQMGEHLRDVVEGIATPQSPAIGAFAKELSDIKDRIHALDTHAGFMTGDLQDQFVQHFPRSLSAGVKKKSGLFDNLFPTDAKLHQREDWVRDIEGGTNEINRILTNPAIHQAIDAAKHLSITDQINAGYAALLHRYPTLDPAKAEVFAKKLVGVPELRTQGLFGNHPIYDLGQAVLSHHHRMRGHQTLVDAITEAANFAPEGVNVGKFLERLKIHPDIGAGHISLKSGRSIPDILNMNLPENLARELQSFAPGYTAPESVNYFGGALRNILTPWKAMTLSMPATRARDFMSGIVQNALMQHGLPSGEGFRIARNIAHGAPIGRDFSHLPGIADLMKRHNLSSDDAVRIAMGVQAPRQHGVLADLVPGQVGGSLQDLLNRIPGFEKSGAREVFKRAGKSLMKGELDAAGNPIATGSSLNPFNVAGVGDREATAFGPVAASNVFSRAGDEFNRHAGIAGQMAQGFDPDVAGKATRAAQVDYDPSTFTPTERAIRNNLLPFYSFFSRMLPHTGKQLLDPGAPLAQLIKAENRAHAQDPTTPQDVMAGTSIPLGTRPDGTKVFMTGAGLMTESASRQIGNALGLNPKEIGYDMLSQLNPLVRTPIEHTLGRSFFKRGAEMSTLDPVLGRIMSDVGNMTGLRESKQPVTYPGSSAVEAALPITPLSRPLQTIRGITDQRKTALDKAVNTLSGIRIRDVSPEQQQRAVLTLAENLAKNEGFRSRADMFFPKDQLDELAAENPDRAERVQEIKALLNKLKRRKARSQK